MSNRPSPTDGEILDHKPQPDGQSANSEWSLVVPRPAVWGGPQALRRRRAEKRGTEERGTEERGTEERGTEERGAETHGGRPAEQREAKREPPSSTPREESGE